MDTHERTLAINLDKTTYGTFAEIGAGQEVARWFLQAGGASGTVAKTISAYDMAFSDAIYGKSGRYVSRDRLLAMLDHEYTLLLDRLKASRGAETRFFVFADTVSARNFSGTNECHGWMGLRFQLAPGGEPNDLVMHVNLRDSTNLLQQQALGLLGVNLLYAAFQVEGTAEKRTAELLAGLSLDRIEIDVLEARGPGVKDPGPAILGTGLVKGGFAQAVLVGPENRLLPPSEILRKRPIVMERSWARQPVQGEAERLATARAQLVEERGGAAEPEPLLLRELSLQSTRAADARDGAPPTIDDAVSWTVARRQEGPVLLTRFGEPFPLTDYLRRFTQEPIRFILTDAVLKAIFVGVARERLEGGLLEGLGKILAANVRLYAAGQLVASAKSLDLPEPLGLLYDYLLQSGCVVPLESR
ncbi:MAG TPA: hypothetical protein VFW45_01460 [Candidatus Polarisedimenticolia bacterium]|nr:hypothetical protein [Candidatus Polarisedimenticolia bacterium]